MAWLRLDDKFSQHPKVVELTDRAFRLHIEVMTYCAEYDTKGAIPSAALKLYGAKPRTITELQDAGLWEQNGVGLVVHDFEIYNGADVTERVVAFLEKHPAATANEVCKAVGGNRQEILGIVKHYRSEDWFQSGS